MDTGRVVHQNVPCGPRATNTRRYDCRLRFIMALRIHIVRAFQRKKAQKYAISTSRVKSNEYCHHGAVNIAVHPVVKGDLT